MRWAQRRTAEWEGRGATVRPREAKWSSGVAAVFWVYYNENVFKNPFGTTTTTATTTTTTTTTSEQHYIIRMYKVHQ